MTDRKLITLEEVKAILTAAEEVTVLAKVSLEEDVIFALQMLWDIMDNAINKKEVKEEVTNADLMAFMRQKKIGK